MAKNRPVDQARREILRKALYVPLIILTLAAKPAFAQGGSDPHPVLWTKQPLYNGIQLPAVWPPKVSALPDVLPEPSYLLNPPAVIPIDVGRQLFVDDFLISQTTMTRTWQKADYHPLNPIIKPDKPWEMEPQGAGYSLAAPGIIPSAMTFNGGVFYDPKDNLFKMWYSAFKYHCLATSRDGITWDKPNLDVKPGTNIVMVIPAGSGQGQLEVWLDLREIDPAKRFKAMSQWFNGDFTSSLALGYIAYFSADGIHWGDPVYKNTGYGDGGNVFYNPFRKVWVASMRDSAVYWPIQGPDKKPLPQDGNRQTRYHEGTDFLSAINWGTVPQANMKGLPGEIDNSVLWTKADRLDESVGGYETDLYDLIANAYESIMLGGFSIMPGIKDGTKLNYGALGFSRDGFFWDRPNRDAFLPRGKSGDWNTGYIHPTAGSPLVVGDKLYFYMGTRQSVAGGTTLDGVRKYNTGLATLRRDGFASMDAGPESAILTTRPVTFSGKYLFVNIDAPAGSLRVEVLNEQGQVMAPFSLSNSVAVKGDKTLVRVDWNNVSDLSALSGKPVRFRFSLTNGRLYSFWVSPSLKGESNGYVGAGGPGFTGPTDTVGSSAQ